MEHSPWWNADSSSASKEISLILWKPEFQCCVHKTQQLIPILSQINSAHLPTPSLTWWLVLLLSSHLCLDPISLLFPSGFLTNFLSAYLFSSMPAVCPAHLIILDLITWTNWRCVLQDEYAEAGFSILLLPPSILAPNTWEYSLINIFFYKCETLVGHIL